MNIMHTTKHPPHSSADKGVKPMLKRRFSFSSFRSFRNAAVLIGIAVVASAYAKIQNTPNQFQQFPSQEIASGHIPEAEVITLRPTGFEPSELTRPPGQFLLTINNRTGLEEINLSISTDLGGMVRGFRLNEGRLRSGSFQALPPGRYVITETEHPEWTCYLTISPN